MSAMQTLSASLVVLVVASPSAAFAQPGLEVPSDVPAGEVHPPPDDEPPSKQAPTGTFAVGVGYRPDDSFIASAGVAQSDLFGTGKALSLDASISQRHQRFAVEYLDPALLGSALQLRATLYHDGRKLPGAWRDGTGASLELSRRVSEHVEVYVGYRFERTQLDLDAPVAARGTTLPPHALDGNIGAMRAGMRYDSLEAPFMPRRGTRFGVQLEAAERDLGSDHSFARLDGWFEHHRPLGPFVLHLGATASAVTRDAPLTERLHFDGSSDVRGFVPGALGPFAGGLSLGADTKLTGRAELELPLSRKLGISAVAWLDGGALLSRGREWTAYSQGVGVLWRSPVGPLRFDWAFPNGDGPARFLFSLGGTF